MAVPTTSSPAFGCNETVAALGLTAVGVVGFGSWDETGAAVAVGVVGVPGVLGVVSVPGLVVSGIVVPVAHW
jgi:hypothetical protein